MTAHLLARMIAQPGARVACIAGGESLTYAGLRARIDAHANALRARGIGAGGIVAFEATRGSETIALLLAILGQRGPGSLLSGVSTPNAPASAPAAPEKK